MSHGGGRTDSCPPSSSSSFLLLLLLLLFSECNGYVDHRERQRKLELEDLDAEKSLKFNVKEAAGAFLKYT